MCPGIALCAQAHTFARACWGWHQARHKVTATQPIRHEDSKDWLGRAVSLCSSEIFVSSTNQQWHVMSSWVTISDLSLEKMIARGRWWADWRFHSNGAPPHQPSLTTWLYTIKHAFKAIQLEHLHLANRLWLLRNLCWQQNLTPLQFVLTVIILRTMDFSGVLSTFSLYNSTCDIEGHILHFGYTWKM